MAPLLAAMSGRPSLGLVVAWMYWPLWITWGFYRKWKMRKDHAEGIRGDQRA